MPELPEVETVRRGLASNLPGREIRQVRTSGKALRSPVPRRLDADLRGRALLAPRRLGKFLLLDLTGGRTMISHLGMSGRWLFFPEGPAERLDHVHVRIEFADGSRLWFQDPRRFGLLRLVDTDRAADHESLRDLGPDAHAQPIDVDRLQALGGGSRVAIKTFLLDQRRLAGIGNIYASEILHRARIDPRRPAAGLSRGDWVSVAHETARVLGEAVERMGTTFSAYRTLWNEPGGYGDQLRVYDRAGEPCGSCGGPVRRIVQAQRSTFYCPRCQGGGGRPAGRIRAEKSPPRK